MLTFDEVISLIKETVEAKKQESLVNPLTYDETRTLISELYDGKTYFTQEGEPRYKFACWFIRNQNLVETPYYLSYYITFEKGKEVMSISLRQR